MPQLAPEYSSADTLAECCAREWSKRQEIQEMILADLAMKGIDSVDVDKIFSEYEEAQLNLRKKLNGPDALNLRKSEINLRSHHIVGGIYGLDYFHQPKQNVKIGKVFLTTG